MIKYFEIANYTNTLVLTVLPLCFHLGDLELRPSTFLIIDPLLGLLKIQETQDLDAGDYTCVAVNDAGRAMGKITLDVGCKHPGSDRQSCSQIDVLFFPGLITLKQLGRNIFQKGKIRVNI